jgi:hypothetical protein
MKTAMQPDRNPKEVIARAMAYDIADVMERYAQETRLPPDALKEHEREIKRFLALSSLNPGKYGMRGPMDELWHTFIIFTSKYAKFCRDLGGDFIHHMPKTPAERTPDPKAPQKPSSYIAFLKDYERAFAEPAPAHLWPRVGGEVLDPSCDQCGIFCAQTCVAIEMLEETQPRF